MRSSWRRQTGVMFPHAYERAKLGSSRCCSFFPVFPCFLFPMNSLSLPCYCPPSLTSLRKKKKRKNYVTRTKHLKNKTRQHLLNKFILCWHMVFVSVLFSFPLVGHAVEDSGADTSNWALLRRGLKWQYTNYKMLVGRVVVQFVVDCPQFDTILVIEISDCLREIKTTTFTPKHWKHNWGLWQVL